jgi:putative two-component system response regulator
MLKSEKIENSWKNEAYDTYTTLVHSLKSSARTIGAIEVSDLAKNLENAGKNGEIDVIAKETPLLLEKYRDLKNHL